MDLGKHEGCRLVSLSTHDKVFNMGKNTRDENKNDTQTTTGKGLQNDGSNVNFSFPTPEKKRKFMEVSRHDIAESRSSRDIE